MKQGVGSCVVFAESGASKKDYRLFNIPKKLSGNDTGSLEHVIERRLKYFDNPETKPDLILIDGGKNQLKFVADVINSSEHSDIKVISIVKGASRFRATETIIGKDGIVEIKVNSREKGTRFFDSKAEMGEIYGISFVLS